MPFMAWNDRLMVHIEELDQDHKHLVQLLNTLYDAIQSGSGKDTLPDLLEELARYTRFHFAHEERLFEKTGYPAAKAHAEQHETMVEWVMAVRADYIRGSGPGLPLHVVNYLKDWLFDHILHSDQSYVSYLHASGVH